MSTISGVSATQELQQARTNFNQAIDDLAELSGADASSQEATAEMSEVLNQVKASLNELSDISSDIQKLLDKGNPSDSQIQDLLNQAQDLQSQLSAANQISQDPAILQVLGEINGAVQDGIDELKHAKSENDNDSVGNYVQKAVHSQLASLQANPDMVTKPTKAFVKPTAMVTTTPSQMISTSGLNFTATGNVGNYGINSLLQYLSDNAPISGSVDIMLIVMAVFIGNANIKAATLANTSSLMSNNIQNVNTLNNAVSTLQAIQNLTPTNYTAHYPDLIIGGAAPLSTDPYVINSFEELLMMAVVTAPGSSGSNVTDNATPSFSQIQSAFKSLTAAFANDGTTITDPQAGNTPPPSPPITTVAELYARFYGEVNTTQNHNLAVQDAHELFTYFFGTANQSLTQIQSPTLNTPTATDSYPSTVTTLPAYTVYTLTQTAIQSMVSAASAGAALGNTTSNSLSLNLQAGQQMYTASLDAAKSAITTLQTVVSSIWR